MDHVEGPLHSLLVEKEGQAYLTTVATYLHSLFFHSLFEFYIGVEGKESMMDHIEISLE
jgi:hypothetical protein